MNVAGVELKMVTYPDGAASAVQAAAQGVDIEGVTVSLAEARSFIESGNLVCLGLMSENRINNKVFGDIPTCKEQGVNAFYSTWRGLGFPNGVDQAKRAKIAEACKVAVNDPDFVKYMANAGLGIAYMDAAEFKAFLEQQEEKDVPEAMKAAGIEI